eukprot:7089381-Prymnesium_polylepis.1
MGSRVPAALPAETRNVFSPHASQRARWLAVDAHTRVHAHRRSAKPETRNTVDWWTGRGVGIAESGYPPRRAARAASGGLTAH